MTDKQPYSYSVLRYVHDVMTGEFVNVGVVLHAPVSGFFAGKIRPTIGRLKEAFPDLKRADFKSAMKSVERAISRAAKDQRKSTLFGPVNDVLKLVSSVFPRDDSSLQWSGPGTGITSDPQATLDRLYDRLVARYDHKFRGRRTDDEIWKPVRQKLEQKHLASCLQEKVFHGRSDEIVFEHAWKNGVWHCYQPISLDLADADGIKEKARRWLGHLTSVADATEKFKPYFLVGAPKNPELASAFTSAVAILRKSPLAPEIFGEDQVDDLVMQIEDDIHLHSPQHLISPTGQSSPQ